MATETPLYMNSENAINDSKNTGAVSSKLGSLSAFGLFDDALYKEWRDAKLSGYPDSLDQVIVSIANPEALTSAEKQKIHHAIAKTNFAVFQCEHPESVTKGSLTKLGAQFGLKQLDGNLCSDEDSVSSITVDDSGKKNTYIPYTNRAISWHTDGYYNDVPEHAVRSFVLYCAQSAAKGGTNKIMDHELAYIYLRDRDPEMAKAMFHPEAMSIPANIVDGKEIRAEHIGPVFMEEDNQLSMRYTARTRSIHWREEAKTEEAVQALIELFKSDHPGIFEHTMQPGQGIISNNILHMRTGFEDAPEVAPRLYYRARYYQRISNQNKEIHTC